jgi:hypothetical protein
VKQTKITIAATLPQIIANFCWALGSVRDARAITTALSPDNKIFVRMIDPKANQKLPVVKSLLSPSSFYKKLQLPKEL